MYKCNVCSKEFKIKSKLKRHEIHVHSSEGAKTYHCDLCPKFYKSSDSLKTHKNEKHSDSVFECDLCSRKFVRKIMLEKHKKTIHEEGKFECKICKKWFHKQRNLNDHIASKHQHVRFKCTQCDKEFLILYSLRDHIARVHEGISKSFECQTCGNKFKYIGDLSKHVRKVHDNLRYTCDICGNNYTSKQNLSYHMDYHMGFDYNCDKCPKICVTKQQLNFHENAYHTNAVKCESCSQEFISNVFLAYHNEGSKMCRVDNCIQKFACVYLRKKHEKLDHVYECALCDKKYKSHASLACHNINFHKKLACVNCKNSFSGVNALRNHKYKDHDWFKCEICKKNLTGDQAIHNNKVHSKCKVCNDEVGSRPFAAIVKCELSHMPQRFDMDEILKNYNNKYCSFEENNFFSPIDDEKNCFELDRTLPLSHTGHISISGKEFEPKFYTARNINAGDEAECLPLGKHICAFKEGNWTSGLLEDLIIEEKITSERPRSYFQYTNDLSKGLRALKVSREEKHDLGHIATSSYAHEICDRIHRQMHHNITLMPKNFNQGQFSCLERYCLKEAQVRSGQKGFIKLVREFILIHDDTCKHPLGNPNFIIVIVSFIYEENVDIKIFALPNAPLIPVFEFFELTLFQFEEVFNLCLMNEINFCKIENLDFHAQKCCSSKTISTEELQQLLSLSKDELMNHPLITEEREA